MTKRFLALVVTIALVMVLFIPSSLAYFTMWVYTENGGSLNARLTPSYGDNVAFQIPYGEEVTVEYHLGNGWTRLMAAGAYECVYVQTRYLVASQPGPRPTPHGGGGGGSGSGSSASAAEMTAINKEFAAARRVTPYTVETKSSRSTGSVNMRWAPHKKAELIRSYKSGVELTVIAELKDWMQVEDPQTGDVGFIRHDFLVR